MFSFEEINYTTDAFRAVIVTANDYPDLDINAVKVTITDNYTDKVLEDMIFSSLSVAVKFVENY